MASPVLSLNNAAATVLEQQGLVAIDAAGTLNDADGDANWDGGTITVTMTNGTLFDRIGIISTPGAINTGSNATVLFNGGTAIGTVSAPGGTIVGLPQNQLVITFNQNATNVLVQDTLRAIAYQFVGNDPSDGLPSPLTRTVTITAADADGNEAVDMRDFDITPINDPPSISATSLSPDFFEGDAPVSLFTAVGSNPGEDGQNYNSFTISVSNVTDGASETLQIDGTSIALTDGNVGTTGITGLSFAVSQNVTETLVTISKSGGTISSALLGTLIATMAYQNTSEGPTPGNRVVEIFSIVDDGGVVNGGQNTAFPGLTSTVAVDANDLPDARDDNLGTASETEATVVGNVLADNGNGADTNPDPGNLKVVSVNGTDFTGSESFDVFDGAILDMNDDGTFTLNVNNAFEFIPEGENEAFDFTYTIEDAQGDRDTATGTFTFTGIDNNDTYTGTNGDDDFSTGMGDDTLKGRAGNDMLSGENGEDTLFGGSEDDTLRGGKDDDVLKGQSGSDVLDGGRNRDKLFGGSEDDIFDFNKTTESKVGSARDIIFDLERGLDQIDVKDIDAKKSKSGDQKFKWIGKDDFTGKEGQLRYEDKGAKVFVQGDVNGNGKANFEIMVKVGRVGEDDFIL